MAPYYAIYKVSHAKNDNDWYISDKLPNEDTYVEYEEIINTYCSECNTSGYITTTPIKYCNCTLGLFYQGKISEIKQDVFETGELILPYIEYNRLIDTIDLFYELPFHIGVL